MDAPQIGYTLAELRSEEAVVRDALQGDPFVSNEDYGRLVEEAIDADERESWKVESV